MNCESCNHTTCKDGTEGATCDVCGEEYWVCYQTNDLNCCGCGDEIMEPLCRSCESKRNSDEYEESKRRANALLALPWHPIVTQALRAVKDEQTTWTGVSKLLFSIFPTESPYTVEPTAFHGGGVDNCVWPALHFTVRWKDLYVLWIELDSPERFQSVVERSRAFERMDRGRLGINVFTNHPLPLFSGLIFFGTKYAIVSVEKSTGLISPVRPPQDMNRINVNDPPIEWWTDCLSPEGSRKLHDFMMCLKQTAESTHN